MAGNNIHSQITDQAEIHVPKGFTEAQNHSALTKSIGGQLVWRDLDSLGEANNFTATADPVATDDSSAGYVAGSRWVNVTTRTEFTCVDATVNAAQWRVLIRNNFAPADPTIAADIAAGYSVGSIWSNSLTNEVWVCARNDLANAEWKSVTDPDIVGFDHRTLSHMVAPADDHTQYLHIDGRRAMTGTFDMGNQSLVNALQVNGVKIPTANILRVSLNPGSAEYSSIATACAAAGALATADSPYLVQVAPGTYTENPFMIPAHVDLNGSGNDVTIIDAANPDVALITLEQSTTISNMGIRGTNGLNGIAVNFAPTALSIRGLLSRVRFTDNTTLVSCIDPPTDCVLILTDCDSARASSFTTGVKVQSSSSKVTLLTTDCIFTQTTSDPTAVIMDISGTAVNAFIKSDYFEFYQGTVGTHVLLYNGATLTSAGTILEGGGTGLSVPNIGAGPHVHITGAISVTPLISTSILHPSATGSFDATASVGSSTIVNPTLISLLILDPDGSTYTSGPQFARQPDSTFTDITTLTSQASPTGLLGDGDIDVPLVGLSSTVGAGYGYVHKSDGSLRKVTWPSTPYTVPANSTQYLYFDENAVLHMATMQPDYSENIILGRVVSNATNVMIVDESGFIATHASTTIGQALRNGLGAVYSSGSNLSEAGTRNINVTPGIYYFGERRYTPQGGNALTFTAFYQDGLGGYVNIPAQTVVDNAQYDNGSGALVPITAGFYAKHSIYCLGDSTGDTDSERYFLVYAQAQYNALTLAEQGALSNPPNFLSEGVTLIASIIVQQGLAHFAEVRDERPIISSKRSSTVAATTFHSNLLGLTVGDDHPQYWRGDGTHVATGDFNHGGHNITNLGTANGVVVEAHATRHQPGGADAIPTSAAFTLTPDLGNAIGTSANLSRADHIHNVPTAAATTLDSTTTNTQGVNASFSRSDHTHVVTSGVPVTINTDQSNSAGVGPGFAKADHMHNIPTAIAVGLSANSSNTQGVSPNFSRADHTHFIASGTPVQQTPNQTNTAGVSGQFSRTDHVHNIPTGVASGLNAGSTNTQGTAAAFSQQDHTHLIASGAPSTQTPDQANTTGTSTNFARADHLHQIVTAAPSTQTPNQANSVGVLTSFSRADHIHNVPTAAAVGLSATTTNTQGSAASFAQSDHTHAISTGTPSTQTPDQANATGTSANIARADHIHTIATATAVSVAPTNTQGVATSFSRSDHGHQGVHSIKANAGSQEFGDLTLASGNGTTVVDSPAGTFTVDTTFGPNEFVVTGTAGLQINYTGGRFINGVLGQAVNVPSGTATVTANTAVGYLYVAVNSLNSASASVVASATPPGVGYLPFAQYSSGPSTVTSVTDTRAFVNTAPLIHSLRVYYTGAGLTVNYNSSDVRINGVFTTINPGTLLLTNAIATGAIYVDATTAVVTANTTGVFPPNCVPLATYTTAGGNVTALSLVRTYIGNNVVFGLAGDIVTIVPNAVTAAGSTNKYADAGHTHAVATAAAVTQTPDQANAAGASNNFARADHVHNIPTATAVTISSNANTQGAAATFARADHTHELTAAAALLDHAPQYDGSNWQAVYPEAALVPGRAWYKQDEFLSNSGNSTTIIGELTWSVSVNGGGSAVATNTAQLDANHPGIIRLTANGGGGTASIIMNPNAIVQLGGGVLTNEWLIQIPTLANVTNDFTFRCGLGDVTTADFNNGVYFEYTRATSTNWLIKTANGGTRTSTTTATAVTGGAWIKLQIVVNAAASSVQYFINGTSVGTVTTNIPTAGTSFAAHQLRTAGTPVGVDIDYFNVYQRFTTSR